MANRKSRQSRSCRCPIRPAVCLKSLGVLVDSQPYRRTNTLTPFADRPITVFVRYAVFASADDSNNNALASLLLCISKARNNILNLNVLNFAKRMIDAVTAGCLRDVLATFDDESSQRQQPRLALRYNFSNTL